MVQPAHFVQACTGVCRLCHTRSPTMSSVDTLWMKLEETGETIPCGEQWNSCPHIEACGRIGGEDGTEWAKCG